MVLVLQHVRTEEEYGINTVETPLCRIPLAHHSMTLASPPLAWFRKRRLGGGKLLVCCHKKFLHFIHLQLDGVMRDDLIVFVPGLVHLQEYNRVRDGAAVR